MLFDAEMFVSDYKRISDFFVVENPDSIFRRYQVAANYQVERLSFLGDQLPSQVKTRKKKAFMFKWSAVRYAKQINARHNTISQHIPQDKN